MRISGLELAEAPGSSHGLLQRAAAGGLALANAPLLARFEAALSDPARAQRETLSRILQGTSRTEYGREHLAAIPSGDPYPAFREAFSPRDHASLSPWLEAQRAEEAEALCPGKVLAYEPTSGSSGGRKLIPYNAALKASFDSLFRLWSTDLLRHGPALPSLRTFLSMSPGGGRETATARGVPIGFPDDRSYLAPVTRLLASRFFADAAPLKSLDAEEDFLHGLSLLLLSEEDLGIASIWSPTYLLAALDHIETHADRLRRDLADGTPALRPGGRPWRLRPLSRRRADLLLQKPIPWEALWPMLRLVSCWDAGQAAPSARELARRLPGVAFQGKGLLATEGPVTVPWIRSGGCLPLLTEVFLEFESADGGIRLLHELDTGAEYSVLLTQQAGLIRYRLGDRIRAGTPWRGTPTLEFLGREGETSDLAGEKLGPEAFLRAASRIAAGAADALRGDWIVLPLHNGRDAGYVLLMDQSGADPAAVAESMERELLASHHYRHCRRMGQLRPLRAERRPGLPDLRRRHALARGIRIGDAKPRILIADPAEAEAFYALSNGSLRISDLQPANEVHP